MLFVLLSWVLITTVFLSFGDITVLLWNKVANRTERYGFLDTFWIGLCATGVLSVLASLWFPINGYLLLSFLIITTVCICIRYKFYLNLGKELWTNYSNLSIIPKIATILTFFALLVFALSAPMSYDFELYHLQSIMWTEGYSVVPGLGNVHGRFGFNSTFLLLSTLFGYHPNLYNPLFTLNSLCLFLFSIWLIIKISNLKSSIQQIILLLTLTLFSSAYIRSLSSTSTDILVNILVIYLLLKSVLSSYKIRKDALLYSFVPLFCITLKLSSAAIVLFTAFILLSLLRQKDYRSSITLAIWGSIVIILWCTRFIILTGYLIYPFPSIDIFSFDWKMPLQSVIDEKDAATAWARIAQRPAREVLAMPFIEWFPQWINNVKPIDLSLYLLASISFIIVAVRRKIMNANNSLLAWVIAFCGFIFSFIGAPDPRFAYGFIICCGFIPLLSIETNSIKPNKFYSKIRICILLLLCIFFGKFIRLGTKQIKSFQPENISYKGLVIKPQSFISSKNKNNATFTENKLSDNFTIFSPDVGDRCFDECLPCMPYFDSRLEMRGKNLEDGFRLKKAE